jgi:hypothetical protein
LYLCGKDVGYVYKYNYITGLVDTIIFNDTVLRKLPNPVGVLVDSPNVFFSSNNSGSFFNGNIDNKKVYNLGIKIPIFTKYAWLSNNKIAVRGFRDSSMFQSFMIIDVISRKVIKDEKLIDHDMTGFATDGVLKYDSINKSIFYVEYFSNRLYCLDTNLSVKYIGHTIDTVNSNPVDIRNVKNSDNNESIESFGSRVVVNNDFVFFKKYLFVQSKLKSDDEELYKFNENIVIDVYLVSNGNYAGSFYIPRNGRNIRSFYCFQNRIFLLDEKGAYIYQLTI